MSLCLIAMTLSIDALGIGAAYGIRGIKIPVAAKSIIFLLTALITLFSVSLGRWIGSFVSESTSVIIGVAILLLMGLYIIFQSPQETSAEKKKPDEPTTVLDIFIKSIGISIKIIKNPLSGDSNNSKIIEPMEAVYLSIALCIDSLGAGFACAVAGIGFLSIPVVVSMFQLTFLCAGMYAGSKMRKVPAFNENLCSYISGAALIFVAIVRMLKAF